MLPTLLSSEMVHPDTQAVLLLCGAFVAVEGQGERPLTLKEYNAVAQWLVRQKKRPADLLASALDSPPDDVAGFPTGDRVRALLSRGFQMATAVERWQRLGIWVMSRGDNRYPKRLRRQLGSTAPPLLFGAGDVSRLDEGGLAVVGSRDVDEEGLSFTRGVAERCAEAGVTIISGAARGVDRAALLAALELGGRAVAIPADRLDRMTTSRESKEYIRRGLLTLVSPYEPEWGFTVGRAMGRNKHIYALADNALIVRFSAGEGGTWAGAVERLNLNQRTPAVVPVFVRVTHNPEDGWQELRESGAFQFPEENFWREDVLQVLARVAQGQCAPQPLSPTEPAAASEAAVPSGVTPFNGHHPLVETPSPAIDAAGPASTSVDSVSGVSGSDTFYTLCLPLLLQCLTNEPGRKDLKALAPKLDVLPQQLNVWLDRALAEGLVIERKTKRRKVVFVPASRGAVANRSCRDDDAA